MDEPLGYYEENIQKLRNRGKEWKITDEEIDKIIDESFKFLEIYSQTKGKLTNRRRLKVWALLFALVVLFLLMLSYRKTAHNFLERNIQEVIYPAMKGLRKLMLPVVKLFPSITEWYDEACLVSNPYFKVSDIDCWPCENVRSILNLTLSNLDNDAYHSGIPFIIKDFGIGTVDFKVLRTVYRNNKKMFDKDAPRIEDSNGQWQSAHDLFELNLRSDSLSDNKDSHITWKLNRLEPTRLIRSLFGMPQRVPNYVAGATPEKYILMDEYKSLPYYLPATEGTTVSIIQGYGSRLFVLEPSKECSMSCHRVSVLLKPNHVLWYNWWYWRAISIPVDHSSAFSITYVSSYY
ncbi:hypothetical protein O3M35_006188 [Rhynocoris fuscipes]|uniref:Uncharacterized protein n=1 Tax=Rhynocoris fuscipes TaxID=488301 RepID=A0AAW1DJU7_9HEMI